MVIKKKTNIALEGKQQRPIPTDIFYSEKGNSQPVLLFCHGYKGFKDWGAWNLMAEDFVRRGFIVVKFNFAFNGGTLENPIDFPDLEAFGKNSYSKELDDLEVVIDWISSKDFPLAGNADLSRLNLMGHSRGGGVAVIKAAEDARIKKLITLAAVSDLGSRFPTGEALEIWEKNDIAYVENARTKQQMPHLYEFYQDFKRNEARFTIQRAAKTLDIPTLILHGTNDPTVDVKNANDLASWIKNSELFLLEGSDHVFEASHPWENENMPLAMEKVVEKVASFME